MALFVTWGAVGALTVEARGDRPRDLTLTRALAEDDNSEERAILRESGARPGVSWFAS